MEKPKMSLYELLLNFIFFIPVTLKISGAWLIKRAYGSENRDGWVEEFQ
jgi:hypothetical protein